MPRGSAKDESKPKGRMTAYAYFVQTQRDEQKKKNPDEAVAFTEFSKTCAEQWKKMSEKDKSKYQKMAEKDKARYDGEMKSYKPAPEAAGGRGKKGKKGKDPNAPKRSMSAFFWFCDEERPKVRKAHSEWTVGEVAKELGRRWATVSDADKARFQKQADKDKARYAKEMDAYRSGGGGGGGGGRAKKAKVEEEEDDEEEEEEEEDEEDDE
jgi:hypothetical protein